MNRQPANKIHCFLKSPSVLALFCLILSCYAIDLESAKEQSCLSIKKTVNVDAQLMSSVKTWYYPLMSRLDLYRTSLDMYGNTDDPTKLRESQVYYDNCYKVEILENVPYATGFHGKQSTFTFDPPLVNDDGVTSQKFTSPSGLGWVTYTTLTDNATFIFSAVCWDDNQASWGVASTTTTLPADTVKLIYEHAESLGFKREYFEELRYGYCDEEQTDIVQKRDTCVEK